MSETKPPLGVVPRRIHEDLRAKDLARAIHEYLQADKYGPHLIEWVNELHEYLNKGRSR